ncbi:RNA polymerase sigma factor (sigma-70 family) [Catalinimonas alkaloidigena]|uniref:sigma-70 family RNA polymerase sigma factor n=1 Tax=Catalinimonas alkaloidigena TaxID=1075417 RepID=UPI0024057262|nr:sigma-70 family RNA polymerase sigma factor [Catalinimonas alkaloidigena]MDF9799526.1 RNA polymerase sigma factor (sigma-70 family) [Catalinimonas alkaloidigena]
MSQTQTISLYQPLLYAIALRMVGSLQDAEDIVQDTFMKWLTIDQEKIENTKAYLIRTVTNNCINHLNSFRKKKSEYFSNLKNSELLEKYRDFELPRFDLENELSEALALVHKKLEPVEKGIYLLREVFDYEYEDLQEIFGKKKENCRQLFSRAKEKLQQENRKKSSTDTQPLQLLESFKKACNFGQLSEFVNQVSHEVNKFTLQKK